MPTAAEYDLWAWRLESTADETVAVTGPLAGQATPEAISGGLLAVTVDLAVRASQANSIDAAGKLRELAQVCTERALVCAAYDVAMDEYDRRLASYNSAIATYADMVEEAAASGGYVGSPPMAPTRPPTPEPWVERS